MKKQIVFVYTRINGVETVKGIWQWMPKPKAKVGMVENREFHEALGLKVGER